MSRPPLPDRQCAECGGYHIKDGKFLDWWDYMVEDEVWFAAGFKKKEVACLPCLEKRLGRQVTRDDFTTARCNNTIRYLLGRNSQ